MVFLVWGFGGSESSLLRELMILQVLEVLVQRTVSRGLELSLPPFVKAIPREI